MASRSTDTHAAADAALPELPLRLGGADDFTRVRALLERAGFEEAAVCRALEIDQMHDLSAIRPEDVDFSAVGSEALAALMRLFLFRRAMPCAELERLFDARDLGALLSLEVLRRGDSAGGSYSSSVFLYPVAGLFIASDWYQKADDSLPIPMSDIVYPAISETTLGFLRVMASSGVADVLDIGTGSGVAALLLSRTCDRPVASDITPRATHFAAFNRMLNGCDNVEIVRGDLYEPVSGRTFDRIVSQPPFMPSFANRLIYRDGGETGERLVKRIVEGLPEHLRPGGTLYCMCMGLDTDEGRFEERARAWLGESRDEFDLAFACQSEESPTAFVTRAAERDPSATDSDIRRWREVLQSIGVRRLVAGVLVMQRRGAGSGTSPSGTGAPFSLRTGMSKDTTASCFEWMFGWRQWRARPSALEELAQLRPRLAPRMSVKTTHRVREGGLVPAEILLESDSPFPVLTRVDPWVVPVIAKFDGTFTPADLYDVARGASKLPESVGVTDFLNFVADLIERGYLQLDDRPFPELAG
jgi:SAM-dependent methyltransferase